MSGRHHLPSTPSRPLLKAGAVAAAAVTGPLAVAGTAVAAPAASSGTWDELAMCESTKNWDADTGNGFKGGLQFTDSTWSSFGGDQYADSADEASRSEQITVARKVQDEQGWNAWPTCSEELGLQ